MFVSVDGNYTEWTAWTACDKTCGAGLMARWRACANPSPQYGGRDCSMYGQDTETKSCQIKDYCPSKSFLLLQDYLVCKIIVAINARTFIFSLSLLSE